MTAHELLNVFIELRNNDKMPGLLSIYHFFAINLIGSIIHYHEC